MTASTTRPDDPLPPGGPIGWPGTPAQDDVLPGGGPIGWPARPDDAAAEGSGESGSGVSSAPAPG